MDPSEGTTSRDRPGRGHTPPLSPVQGGTSNSSGSAVMPTLQFSLFGHGTGDSGNTDSVHPPPPATGAPFTSAFDLDTSSVGRSTYIPRHGGRGSAEKGVGLDQTGARAPVPSLTELGNQMGGVPMEPFAGAHYAPAPLPSPTQAPSGGEGLAYQPQHLTAEANPYHHQRTPTSASGPSSAPAIAPESRKSRSRRRQQPQHQPQHPHKYQPQHPHQHQQQTPSHGRGAPWDSALHAGAGAGINQLYLPDNALYARQPNQPAYAPLGNQQQQQPHIAAGRSEGNGQNQLHYTQVAQSGSGGYGSLQPQHQPQPSPRQEPSPNYHADSTDMYGAGGMGAMHSGHLPRGAVAQHGLANSSAGPMNPPYAYFLSPTALGDQGARSMQAGGDRIPSLASAGGGAGSGGNVYEGDLGVEERQGRHLMPSDISPPSLAYDQRGVFRSPLGQQPQPQPHGQIQQHSFAPQDPNSAVPGAGASAGRGGDVGVQSAGSQSTPGIGDLGGAAPGSVPGSGSGPPGGTVVGADVIGGAERDTVAEAIAEWVEGIIESNGGSITSANLGIMCLRSQNAAFYRAMKDRYGGLRALLSKFPERFILLGNRPRNHILLASHHAANTAPTLTLQPAPSQQPQPQHQFQYQHQPQVRQVPSFAHHATPPLGAHGISPHVSQSMPSATGSPYMATTQTSSGMCVSAGAPTTSTDQSRGHSQVQGQERGRPMFYLAASAALPIAMGQNQTQSRSQDLHAPQYSPPSFFSPGNFNAGVAANVSRGPVGAVGAHVPGMVAPEAAIGGKVSAPAHGFGAGDMVVGAGDETAGSGDKVTEDGSSDRSPLILEELRQDVMKSTRLILMTTEGHSLKAVKIANALRSHIGSEALVQVREMCGGLLNVLEMYPQVFRVCRVPKNDTVELVMTPPPMPPIPTCVPMSDRASYVTSAPAPPTASLHGAVGGPAPTTLVSANSKPLAGTTMQPNFAVVGSVQSSSHSSLDSFGSNPLLSSGGSFDDAPPPMPQGLNSSPIWPASTMSTSSFGLPFKPAVHPAGEAADAAAASAAAQLQSFNMPMASSGAPVAQQHHPLSMHAPQSMHHPMHSSSSGDLDTIFYHGIEATARALAEASLETSVTPPPDASVSANNPQASTQGM